MFRDNCSLIGYISKPHGTSGDVNIRLSGFDSENIEPGESLFVEINGTLIPFFIMEITPKADMALVHLKFVDSIEEAKKLSGKNIYLLSSLAKKNLKEIPPDPSIFIGFQLIDSVSGIRGEIADYIDNPLNPLFLVRTGEKEFLVPVHPGIIVSIDEEERIITAELPEGLVDIN